MSQQENLEVSMSKSRCQSAMRLIWIRLLSLQASQGVDAERQLAEGSTRSEPTPLGVRLTLGNASHKRMLKSIDAKQDAIKQLIDLAMKMLTTDVNK